MTPGGRTRPRLTPADPGSAERLATSGPEWQFLGQIRTLGLPVPSREVAFALPRKWRLDFAWPDQMVAVEAQGGTHSGGRHVRGAGYEQDCEKLNAAVLRGWRVLLFTTEMIEDGTAIETLAEALGQR